MAEGKGSGPEGRAAKGRRDWLAGGVGGGETLLAEAGDQAVVAAAEDREPLGVPLAVLAAGLRIAARGGLPQAGVHAHVLAVHRQEIVRRRLADGMSRQDTAEVVSATVYRTGSGGAGDAGDLSGLVTVGPVHHEDRAVEIV